MEHKKGNRRILKLIDLNELFVISEGAVLLNKINYATKEHADRLHSKLYAKSGELTYVVSCTCGHLSGNFYENTKCPICNTLATSEFTSNDRLVNEAWLGFPESVPGVLHPVIYNILSTWLRTKQNGSYIDIILNPKLELPAELQGKILGRGYNYFYHNFDYIMDYFLHHHKTTVKKKAAVYVELLLKQYRYLVFTRYLPVLANVLHTITSEGSGQRSRSYIDKSSQYILEAATNLSILEYSSSRHRSSSDFDALVHGAYKSYITYIKGKDGIIDRLRSKVSLLRRHIFGTRFHWSFRSVIVPIIGPHRYDELHLPWSVGVNLFKIHLIGRLTQSHNMSYPEAVERQAKAVVTYDPLIDKLMDEFIEESPFLGAPVVLNRPPTLQRGSLQLLYVTRIKPDPDDLTIGISVLVLKDPKLVTYV